MKGMLLAILSAGMCSGSLAQIKTAIDKKDVKTFDAAYRRTITECYACHQLAEKPYLRLHIPEAPATGMIDLRPNAD